MNRRAFVAVSGSALAAACVTPRRTPAVHEVAASAAGLLEPELRVFNWSDYIASNTIADFEREFHVRVVYDTYESNEEMVAKLVAGGDAYDIVAPSGYLIPVLVDGGMLQPFDFGVLGNWHNLVPLFAGAQGPRYGRYTMPYQWGTTGIAYRQDLVAHPPVGWETFVDPTLRERLTMLDDGREVLGAMLKWRGHSVNSTHRSELEHARDDAIAIKPNLRAYLSATVKAQLVSGDIAAAQLWSGDTHQAQREESRIAYVLPSEGSMIFTDYLAIPRRAPHRRAAHAFLNYVLRPEVGAAISDQTGYGSVNAASLAVMQHPTPPPAGDVLRRLEFERDLGAAADLWDRLWTEIKAA